jgi:hypothetical protein
MKKTKTMIHFTLILTLGLIILPAEGKAQMGPGMMGYGPGYGGWSCPYCGRYMGPEAGYGMGPWMMGRGWGYGMGPGMMGPGWGYGPGPMGPGMMGPGYGYGPQYQQPQTPLTEKDASGMLEDYLQTTRNPNLKLGKITDKGPYYEAEIVTKNNALVDKILVDKNTGWMRSVY